jgi:hypothetical protein
VEGLSPGGHTVVKSQSVGCQKWRCHLERFVLSVCLSQVPAHTKQIIEAAQIGERDPSNI